MSESVFQLAKEPCGGHRPAASLARAHLAREGGHIGCDVRPSERSKGYRHGAAGAGDRKGTRTRVRGEMYR